MSFTISTDVFCDICPKWVHGTCSSRPEKAKAWLRAQDDGWKKVDGKHVCPDCQEKLEAKNER